MDTLKFEVNLFFLKVLEIIYLNNFFSKMPLSSLEIIFLSVGGMGFCGGVA